MGRRLILDSTVLVEYERGRLDRSQFDDDLAVAAVTIAEFRRGVELADTAERRERRLAALDGLLEVVGVLDYTEATAGEHARLLALVVRQGRPRGAHDLIIAAHAAETGRAIVSHDSAARFGELAGVTASEAE